MRKLAPTTRRLLFLAFILLAVPLSVYVIYQGVQYKIRASYTPVSLTFSDAELSISKTGNIHLILDPKMYKIGRIKAVIIFDPTKIQLTDEITLDNRFRKVLEKTNKEKANQEGRINIIIEIDPVDFGIAPSEPFEIAKIPVSANGRIDKNNPTKLILSDPEVEIIDVNQVKLTFTKSDAIVTTEEAPIATTTPSLSVADNVDTSTTTSTSTAIIRGKKIGDINEDGYVNLLDYVILFENFKKNPLIDKRADINNDTKVNLLDYIVLFENFEK